MKNNASFFIYTAIVRAKLARCVDLAAQPQWISIPESSVRTIDQILR